jgi:hypothetical protein
LVPLREKGVKTPMKAHTEILSKAVLINYCLFSLTLKTNYSFLIYLSLFFSLSAAEKGLEIIFHLIFTFSASPIKRLLITL